MNNIDKGVIQILDQLKNSGQLNSYLIDDDERKWTKLIYDIMINKFDMPFGNSTMQQASDMFNNAVRVWKGKNKLGNMMNMESRTMNMNIINEIGDTVRGQEMLGRTAERAHQRAQRTSSADKQIHEKTEWDAYQTSAGNSRKHLDGSGAHFARGRDAEYDEHWDDGRYPWSKKHKSKNESKTMNKKLIRLTEQDLHRIVKESVNRVIKEEHYNDAAALPYITKAFDELINKIGNAAVAINGESWDAAISNDPFSKALKLIYQAKRVLLNA